jgi:hypothetical protein
MRSFNVIALGSIAAMLALGESACASSATARQTIVSAPATQAGAPAGACKIDAVKICQTAGGGAAKNPEPMAAGQMGYGASSATMPDTIEFSIPAGPTLQLMCYYDPQHSKVTRADVANQVAMTSATVKYLKDQGFCAQ